MKLSKQEINNLSKIINDEVYAVFEDDLYYIITGEKPDQVYVVDKQLMSLIKQTEAYNEYGASLLANSTMIYSANEDESDADLFDVE